MADLTFTEHTLPNLLDSLSEGCQLIGPDWKYLYLNEAAARQGKRDRSELIGCTMMSEYPGIENTEMFAQLRRCMEQRTLEQFETQFTFPDGSTGWFDLRFEPVPSGVFILSLDITARKRAEQERLLLSTAIDQGAEAVIITESNGNILYVNPAFETVTGFARREVIGRNPRILKSGKQNAAFYRDMWSTLVSGKTWQGRIVNKRKDGTLITGDAVISPVCDSRGEITNYVCVKRDVTRELNLEEQFRQSQKMEAIGQLAGGVAHDFNNLLALIIGYSDVLLRDVEETNPIRPDILEIRRAGERASGLTKQLLAFSRKQIVKPQSLDLNKIVGGMEEMLRRLIGEQIELVVNLAPAATRVRADANQLEQVVMNLVVNARDAMEHGGKLSIDIANVELDGEYVATHFAVQSGPHAMLSVSDSGIGMDKETVSRIFEPFFTTKPSERGTGLGLSTVYGIVKQTHGSIWVYSEIGVGTTFKIYLPRDTSSGKAETPRARSITPVSSGETILVVEDDQAVRTLTERLLTTAGYSIVCAVDSAEALRICAETPGRVALMLTDVVMPGMSGVELAQRLERLYPGMRVLYMSGYAENAVDYFEQIGERAHFIGKPFSAAELVRKVRDVLDT